MERRDFVLKFIEINLYIYHRNKQCSVGGAVLGDGLGSLGDGVLGEFSWKEESDSGLDLSGGESVLLVVSNES